MEFTLRKASLDDRTAIEQLIVDSTRGLSREDYSDEQIEAAIGRSLVLTRTSSLTERTLSLSTPEH